MKKLLLIIIIAVTCSVTAHAQKFKTHKVKQGETIESIAKQYMVTPSDIYALNPDSKKKLETDTVLIIPNSKFKGESLTTETKELVGYDTHKVKRKETLYSLSKEYNIEIDEIKKHNKQLYSENLQKGDKIRIPKYKTIITKVELDNSIKKYKVLPKEGKWRVAYKFGITVDELETLNPNMSAVLQPGDEVNVPNINVEEEKPIEDNYNYYTVLKAEGFYRLKVKLGLTQEQLETLNPNLKETGLVEGMVLKVPENITVGTLNEDAQIVNLTTELKNLKTKRLAVMLPFRLNRVDVDSIPEAKELIKTDRLLSVSLDFHSGVLMALDSAKYLGISTNLKVFDTRNQLSEVSKILDNNDFSAYDAVIGPMLPANFERVAAQLKQDHIPLISPLTKPENLYDNVFQTIPNEENLVKCAIDLVKNDASKTNVVIIADEANTKTSTKLKAEFVTARQIYSKKNKEGKDAYYISSADISDALKSGKNYVFLETANAGFVMNVTNSLNSLNTSRDKEIILITTNKTDAFEYEHVSNVHLSNLKFHYPSIFRVASSDLPSNFVKQYKSKYGVEPNKYAVRGFDLTLDILLRLASEDDLYKASVGGLETEYIENKFRYSKKLFGGYFNEAVYMLQYKDLTIEEVKQ
jgi:LysM repeat protein